MRACRAFLAPSGLNEGRGPGAATNLLGVLNLAKNAEQAECRLVSHAEVEVGRAFAFAASEQGDLSWLLQRYDKRIIGPQIQPGSSLEGQSDRQDLRLAQRQQLGQVHGAQAWMRSCAVQLQEETVVEYLSTWTTARAAAAPHLDSDALCQSVAMCDWRIRSFTRSQGWISAGADDDEEDGQRM